MPTRGLFHEFAAGPFDVALHDFVGAAKPERIAAAHYGDASALAAGASGGVALSSVMVTC